MRYRLTGPFGPVANCHCGFCRRVHGAAFTTVAFVAPDSFDIFLSIVFLIGITIGGLASISGAIYGALFIQFVPNVADEISKAAPWAIFGLFMIGFVYVMPAGVAGAIRMAMARLQRKRQHP